MSSGFRHLGIRGKLVTAFLAIGLVPLAVSSYLSYERSRAALLNDAGDEAATQAVALAERVDQSLAERLGDVTVLAAHPDARGAAPKVTATANIFTKLYGYYDLMVIADVNGKVIAANTVTPDGHPLDTAALVGQSVSGQEWFDRSVSGTLREGEAYIGDLAVDPIVARLYNNRGLVLNFSAPIRDEKGTIVGVWSNRVSWQRTVQAMTHGLVEMRKKLGDNVTIRVVAKNGILLDDDDSQSKDILSFDESALGSVKQLKQGKSGSTTDVSLRTGKHLVTGYALSKGYDKYTGFGWGYLVRQDATEAMAGAIVLRNASLLVGLLSAALIVLVGFLMSRGIARPLAATAEGLERLATGDLTVHLEANSADEVGRMAHAFNQAVGAMGSALGTIGENARTLGTSSDGLSTVSQQMGASAEETSAQAGVVSAAAEQVSKNVQTVATGTEEMMASIKEIAKNASEAARVAGEAVHTAETATQTIAKLGESSIEVGNVIKVITSIAEQTNLLALNATIEAARAGESGKGFAVVANEVKELAKETAKATEDVGRKIAAIQSDTQAAVQAITQINSVIARISDIQAAIAGAVEEQSATTAEMSRNVTEAAKGSVEIAQNVTGVAEAARATAGGATQTQEAARQLAQMASELQALVGQFKCEVAEQQVGRAVSCVEPRALAVAKAA